MAVSHSFTSEHIEHGSDEEGGAERDHHDIKHGDYLGRAEREGARSRRQSVEYRKPESILRPTSLSLLGRARGAATELAAANARCCIKIRGALLCADISKP